MHFFSKQKILLFVSLSMISFCSCDAVVAGDVGVRYYSLAFPEQIVPQNVVLAGIHADILFQSRAIGFPIMDLPSTPGYVGIVKHGAGGLVVPQYVPPADLCNHHNVFTLIQISNIQDAPPSVNQTAYLFFPVDGRQPTTQEAEAWSCANVDAKVDSPITDWYVEMFGGPRVGPCLKMGFLSSDGTAANRPVPAAIITCDHNTMRSPDKDAFWNTFRQIAANPVGRVLLYRLLIEIRRQDHNRNGCCADDVGQVITGIATRNRYRSINIRRDNGWGFDAENPIVHFFDGAEEVPTAAIHDSHDTHFWYRSRLSRHSVVLCACDPSVALLHEMLHWFHLLKRPDRYRRERAGYATKYGGNIHYQTLVSGIMRGTLGKYFWHGLTITPKREAATTSCWSALAQDGRNFPHFEEIRTIIGAPTLTEYRNLSSTAAAGYEYFNGDDISANKYLVSKGLPICFGHTRVVFFEDDAVIQRALTTSGGNAAQNLVDQRCLDRLERDKKPDKHCNKKGIGKFAIW
jgi:hypothetical protein